LEHVERPSFCILFGYVKMKKRIVVFFHVSFGLPVLCKTAAERLALLAGGRA
jgi:hypothetical protein